MTAKSFCPGNVSCVFRIIENKDPMKKHSLGVGFTVNDGAEVSVSFNKNTRKNRRFFVPQKSPISVTSIYFNNKKMRFPTVETVISRLTDKNIEVRIKSKLQLSAGFGMSGACALATAYALGKLLGLKKSKKELALIAHSAEVENHTGLGDIGGQFNGGFNVKLRKGRPLDVIGLPIKNKMIYYQFFSKIETKKVINNEDKKIRINKAGDGSLKKINQYLKTNKKINLKKIIEISKEFSVDSGLLVDKKVKKLIKNIESKGGNASMIMLGNSVFSDVPFAGCKKVKISGRGACLL